MKKEHSIFYNKTVGIRDLFLELNVGRKLFQVLRMEIPSVRTLLSKINTLFGFLTVLDVNQVSLTVSKKAEKMSLRSLYTFSQEWQESNEPPYVKR